MLVGCAAEFDAEALDDCLIELPAFAHLLASSRNKLQMAYAKLCPPYDISGGLLDEVD